jgi:hypothetical protein
VVAAEPSRRESSRQRSPFMVRRLSHSRTALPPSTTGLALRHKPRLTGKPVTLGVVLEVGVTVAEVLDSSDLLMVARRQLEAAGDLEN